MIYPPRVIIILDLILSDQETVKQQKESNE